MGRDAKRRDSTMDDGGAAPGRTVRLGISIPAFALTALATAASMGCTFLFGGGIEKAVSARAAQVTQCPSSGGERVQCLRRLEKLEFGRTSFGKEPDACAFYLEEGTNNARWAPEYAELRRWEFTGSSSRGQNL